MGYKEMKNLANVSLLLYGKAVIPDQIYQFKVNEKTAEKSAGWLPHSAV